MTVFLWSVLDVVVAKNKVKEFILCKQVDCTDTKYYHCTIPRAYQDNTDQIVLIQ